MKKHKESRLDEFECYELNNVLFKLPSSGQFLLPCYPTMLCSKNSFTRM